MHTEFTRKELYDLVWSQPMRTVAASLGISDVALAKHCKKAGIPLPQRGYWAKKQAGKPTIQIALRPRFPGTSDRVGESGSSNYWGPDWAEKFKEIAVPPVPVFDEDMPSVEQHARRLVGEVRCRRAFEPAHPLVAKLLARDDERRKDFAKFRSDYYAPRYDAGIERRRLLIINALFLAATRLGCRPSMNTSKYGQDAGSERDICVMIGRSHVHFTVEPIISKKEGQKERLRLAFGATRDRENSNRVWEDSDERQLEGGLTEVLVEVLVSAELSYRGGLVRHREWIIRRKSEAEAELRRRQDEAERRARELQEKLERERIRRLLSQARALDRANQIRAYVESARLRVAEIPMTQAEFENWASWAQREADRLDPLKSGTIAQAIKEHCEES